MTSFKVVVFSVLLSVLTWRAMATVLIADLTMSRMVELTARSPYCKLHSDRGVIQRMVLSSDPRRVRQMSRGAVSALEAACRDKSLTSGQHGGFVYPGTKWCGPGNRASSYKDLGIHTAEDRCCREHDHCPASLAPGDCRRSACNRGRFTRSHCDCDARFRRCLQALNTETANTLGAVFFNVVQVICFKERRPCSQWQNDHRLKCDPTPVFVKMARYRDRRRPGSLKNLLLLGDSDAAKLNQRLAGALVNTLTDLTGYNEEESKVICSQWKFRPSDKYVPLMPLPSQYF